MLANRETNNEKNKTNQPPPKKELKKKNPKTKMKKTLSYFHRPEVHKKVNEGSQDGPVDTLANLITRVLSLGPRY